MGGDKNSEQRKLFSTRDLFLHASTFLLLISKQRYKFVDKNPRQRTATSSIT